MINDLIITSIRSINFSQSYGVTLFVKKDVPGMQPGDHMVCMMCPICKKLFMYAELGPHLGRRIG